jgi:hypothetical protein
MNPQVTYRKYGIVASLLTVWLIVHQFMAFVVAVVMASTSSSYHDEPATIMYLVLSGFGWVLGLAVFIFGALNLFKDPKGKWLGVLAILFSLVTLGGSTIIAIVASIDTWA